MADKTILHMLTSLKHMSPFDVNMALDAGFDAVATYTGVTPDEVTALVQDAIFSRPPKLSAKTGVFIGGKDALGALDMMDRAKAALVPPFALSIFADPAGSFTTAAAMVACTQRALRRKLERDLAGLRVAVFGATGVVGFSSAVIAAGEGARVTLVGHDGRARVEKIAGGMKERFGVAVEAVDGSTDAGRRAAVHDADVAFVAARAGVQVLSAEDLRGSRLLVAADVNAVPPPGVEGMKVDSDGEPIVGETIGVGPLTIGNVKYRTEAGLFDKMLKADKPVAYDFRDAFRLAREIAG